MAVFNAFITLWCLFYNRPYRAAKLCMCTVFVSLHAACLLNSSRLVVRVDFIFNFSSL